MIASIIGSFIGTILALFILGFTIRKSKECAFCGFKCRTKEEIMKHIIACTAHPMNQEDHK
jgi:hypothetical protein